jgi:starvation-inducible DNA-binding protein
VVPEDKPVATGVRNVDAVAEGLSDVLADTYRLVFKTHAYHWNVEGPLFHAIHTLTEGQYEDMFQAADELAERMRALGRLAPMRMAQILDASVIADAEGTPDARRMVQDLADDHARVSHRLRDLAEIAGEGRDIVTEDLATARSAFHEKAAWMLRSIVA